MKASVATYLDKNASLRIVDIGSRCPRSQHQTYRELFEGTLNWTYVGADVVAGPNVDVIIDPHYQWNMFSDSSCDVVISGQVMEHVDAPWLFANALARICKKDGLCMVTAPSRWRCHREPLDCWRILADGMRSVMTKYAPFTEVECRTVDVDDMHGDTYFVGRRK
jgi:SAM-dependent methyltransferase